MCKVNSERASWDNLDGNKEVDFLIVVEEAEAERFLTSSEMLGSVESSLFTWMTSPQVKQVKLPEIFSRMLCLQVDEMDDMVIILTTGVWLDLMTRRDPGNRSEVKWVSHFQSKEDQSIHPQWINPLNFNTLNGRNNLNFWANEWHRTFLLIYIYIIFSFSFSSTFWFLGISRDSRHKRSHTGAKRAQYRKKRKFELGRQPANTKLGQKRIHTVRTRGGNSKFRALRLDSGSFSWGSEAISRKTRIIDVVYNASNNELVRTKTLVKSAIVQIDATPFRQWYESHYGEVLGKKRQSAEATEVAKASNSVQKKQATRKALAKVDALVEDQFTTGRLYALITSRPGQSGRCDGHVLEGKELEFYIKKIKSHKKN